MAQWFFMSYAHADNRSRDAYLVEKFFQDLRDEVATRTTSVDGADVGYMDTANLNPGESWPSELAAAVRQCRVFIPILTARYFEREYCGREWTLFEMRCRRYASNKACQQPPLVVPVVWAPPVETDFPGFARELQFSVDVADVHTDERRFIDDYARHGLLYVLKRCKSSHANVYETILEKLACRIIQVGSNYELPELSEVALKPLGEIPNRFAQEPGQVVPISTPSTRANFAIVAGCPTEMQAVRGSTAACYGANGREDWAPYYPACGKPIGLVAQRQANSHDLICEWLPVDGSLVCKLREAERDNSLAIVVIDPWTLKVPGYAQFLREFDQHQFTNCAVLIAWNMEDPDTSDQADALNATLSEILARRFQFRNLLRDRIAGPDELENELRDVITELEGFLSPARDPLRATGSSRFSQPPTLSVMITDLC